MELSQIEQMVRWLDEERKRDKAQIAALQERLEQQQRAMTSQSQEIESLEQELSTLRSDVRRTEDYPEMIERTNRELSSAIEELRAQVRRDRLEAQHTRQEEIEMLNESIADLENRFRPFMRYEEQLEARTAGEQRLQSQVQTLRNDLADFSKRTEDRLQSIVYLEEQRRSDARRITEIEGELPTHRKTLDELATRQVRLEDSIRKIPSRVDEAIEIAKSYDEPIEALRVADFQREQKVKRYLEQAAQVEEEVQNLIAETQKYTLLYNQNQQALDALEAFQSRIEKRQNEVSEMQRLTEERLRRQWEEWQANFARDWQKREVSREDHWRRQELSNQQFAERLTEIDEHVDLYFSEIMSLWEAVLSMAERWRDAIQDATRSNQELPSSHLKELRRVAETKHRDLL
jgi:chromosome segregation ATPase